MSDEPRRPLRPRRGAIPTPKSEIEKAPPYVPSDDEAEQSDTPPSERDAPENEHRSRD